ncbi:DNA repair protein rad10 [Edhazardia aedis USNM 41457]|uniref:DNA repair protein rad10 n=1 Tax=Edhazardia aedis (strain USNM 41457) TaxID=1003232 RepID=J9DQY3_EDHAE|nr:DNA repair protein rad10 [Edhazardia aedis USNM 41457]|eukprot:EJW04985.1 DNA repair protein rad10 [Edhazardia aedis USNM 41457]
MIKVNNKQRGNNLLDYLTKSVWFYEDTLVTDYQINDTTSVLFLSCRFHIAKPEYIHKRMRKLRNIKYELKVILVLVDVKNYDSLLCELFNIANLNEHTVIFCYSNEEAARYFSTFESIKNKSAEKLRPKNEDSVEQFLTSIKSVTKRDVGEIKKCCNNLKDLINMNAEKMECIEGVGQKKASILRKYFDMPFN